jgi:filamentous hemagglutinin family protein
MKLFDQTSNGSGIAIYLAASLVTGSSLLFSTPGQAQIVPDATLPANSIVTPNGNSLTIEGGSRAGGNLFHSFKEFSLPTGSEAFFNNAFDVQNIFSRVTGSNISNIDGLIRANGSANLFLLNPNGIIFGPNARLNIGGSFIGSTANSINFADGSFFSATNPQAPPLLTINVPVGLGFGSNSGAIALQGQGHQLRTTNAFTPIVRSRNTTGLQVIAGRTLALVGGEIAFNGGNLTAEAGRIELGSVGAAGVVGINPHPSGWALNYDGISSFRDIRLTERSLADVSGSSAGSIQAQGRVISLSNGSVLIAQNRGTQPAGGISIRADSVELRDYLPNIQIRTGLMSETLGSGAGSDINISTRQLLLQDGGSIFSRTYSNGAGGTVNINATELVQQSGSAPLSPNIASNLNTFTFSDGKGGDLNIQTQQLSLVNGSNFGAATYSSGNGGSVTVNAEAIFVSGKNPISTHSTISASSRGSGSSGGITLNARTVTLQQGGTVSAASFGSGFAGDITINASESVEVSGSDNGSPSQIRASVSVPSQFFQQQFKLSPIPTGNSGDVTINTPVLQVSGGAIVSVGNDGVGTAGTVRINANSLLLENQGNLTADNKSSAGGNIILQVQNLQMRANSQITATAGGSGNGGNLTINADTIVALENSDIRANAVQGQGGNVKIDTFGIFGTQFRPQQTSESDITASSQFGISGNVAITNPEVETRSLIVELPQNLADNSQQITTACAPGEGNRFIVAGRGGLPEDPISALTGRAIWFDDRDLSGSNQTASRSPQNTVVSHQTDAIAEATGWIVNDKGQVELVAQVANPSASWLPPNNCTTNSLPQTR